MPLHDADVQPQPPSLALTAVYMSAVVPTSSTTAPATATTPDCNLVFSNFTIHSDSNPLCVPSEPFYTQSECLLSYGITYVPVGLVGGACRFCQSTLLTSAEQGNHTETRRGACMASRLVWFADFSSPCCQLLCQNMLPTTAEQIEHKYTAPITRPGQYKFQLGKLNAFYSACRYLQQCIDRLYVEPSFHKSVGILQFQGSQPRYWVAGLLWR